MKVLVTGGAGYVGSHVVLALAEDGHDLVVCDDLSGGVREAVLVGELVVADIGGNLDELFRRGAFDAVVHLAASVSAPESVREPCRYYANNTAATLNLLDNCRRHAVRHFIFSSTAAVYGAPSAQPIAEDAPTRPINPYGGSKLACEMMAADIARAAGFNCVILRYFNVAGADPDARIGQCSEASEHLITMACRAAAGQTDGVAVYGADYDTRDGTCVRDYIHVADIADAHRCALDYLERFARRDAPETQTLNCGYGRGYSVAEVLDAAKRVTGADFPVSAAPRRAGDPPQLVADNRRIRKVLGWTPRHDNLDAIIGSAWRWQQRLATGEAP